MQGRENVKCQCVRVHASVQVQLCVHTCVVRVHVHMRACNFSCGSRGRPSGEGSSGITDGRKLGAEQCRHLPCARSYRRAQRSQEGKAELVTCVRSNGEEMRSERQAWAPHGGGVVSALLGKRGNRGAIGSEGRDGPTQVCRGSFWPLRGGQTRRQEQKEEGRSCTIAIFLVRGGVGVVMLMEAVTRKMGFCQDALTD